MTKISIRRMSTVVAILVAGLLAYYLLLHENFLHTSIAEVVDYAQTLDISIHLVVLGLLPVYIAAMVFGAVMFGVYLGQALQRLFIAFSKEQA